MADSKISALTAGTPVLTDVIPYVSDPGGTPVTKKATVANLMISANPAGSVQMFGGASAPTGYLLCNGASLLRADYVGLFAAIGTAFGSADGTHFNVPNLKGKVPVGYNASETEFDVMGETGGEKTHALTSGESGVPAHTHEVFNGVFGLVGGGLGLSGYFASTNWGASTTAGGTSANAAANAVSAHNNLQPYIALNFIIKT